MKEEMTRVIVCGTRDIDVDNNEVYSRIDEILHNAKFASIEIVSGGARGGDRIGEEYSKSRGYGLRVFRADWNAYGRAAGPIRNSKMVEYISKCADPVVIALWDGKSSGTRNTIQTAKSRKIPVHVIECMRALK